MDGQRAQAKPDTVSAGLAARQRGLVTLRQLLSAGVGRGAVEHRACAGRLIRVHRGVYAVGHVPASNAAAWLAAVLACGHGAVLSHHNAAVHWELRAPRADVVHITVPGRTGRKPRRGIAIHRSTILPPSEPARARAGTGACS